MEVSALKRSTLPGLPGPSPLLRLHSDERLIALVRRGQHAAFETLFSRYQSRLLAFCRHMLGSREDAEDVLQEVFAAAFNAILADERAINVRPWLYRIARNRSLNHLRRASAVGVDSMDVHFADHGLSTVDRVLGRESFRQLITDVSQLPETQRTALLLREIDALSYQQIADAMETTMPAVKSLLVRARISLAEAAEARKLTCEEVRHELGEAAEGLLKASPAVRRHVRACDRCKSFRKQLKANNVALALVFPVGPLLLLKKLALTKLAGSAHVAGAGGATAGGATAGATAVAGASGATGGLITAGAGALATKTVAGLAAAAILTAGAVEADRAVTRHHYHRHATAVAATSIPAEEPAVVRSLPQPPTAGTHKLTGTAAAARGVHKHLIKKASPTPPLPPTPIATTAPAPPSKAALPTPPEPPVTPVTQVTTETTQLPTKQTTSTEPTSTSTTETTPTPTPAPEGSPAPGQGAVGSGTAQPNSSGGEPTGGTPPPSG